MSNWIIILVTGVCAFFSWYLAFLAFRMSDSGVALFSAFGLLFGIPFLSAVMKAISKARSSGKGPDTMKAGTPGSAAFVPHWFLMAAMIITVICILAAILIPFFLR